jgi:hypothetical protein
MPPIEVEFKGTWALGKKPKERTTIIRAGKLVNLEPLRDVQMSIYCDEEEKGVILAISDDSIKVQGANDENKEFNDPLKPNIDFDKNKILKVTQSGRQVAKIRHRDYKERLTEADIRELMGVEPEASRGVR